MTSRTQIILMLIGVIALGLCGTVYAHNPYNYSLTNPWPGFGSSHYVIGKFMEDRSGCPNLDPSLWLHTGVDLFSPAGLYFYPCESGEVVKYVDNAVDPWENVIVIKHDSGQPSLHCTTYDHIWPDCSGLLDADYHPGLKAKVEALQKYGTTFSVTTDDVIGLACGLEGSIDPSRAGEDGHLHLRVLVSTDPHFDYLDAVNPLTHGLDYPDDRFPLVLDEWHCDGLIYNQYPPPFHLEDICACAADPMTNNGVATLGVYSAELTEYGRSEPWDSFQLDHRGDYEWGDIYSTDHSDPMECNRLAKYLLQYQSGPAGFPQDLVLCLEDEKGNQSCYDFSVIEVGHSIYNLNAVDGSGNVTVEWEAEFFDPGTYFHIYRSTDGRATYEDIGQVEWTGDGHYEYVDSDVALAFMHHYRILDTEGYDFWGPVSGRPYGVDMPPTPAAPVISVLKLMGDGVWLHLDQPSVYASNYVVSFGESGGLLDGTMEAYGDSCIVSGLVNGISYDFRVKGSNQTGESSESDLVSGVPLSVPQGLDVDRGNSSLLVSWSSVPAVHDYIVNLESDLGDQSLNVSATDTTIGELVNGETYVVSVEAEDQYGNSSDPCEKILGTPYGPSAVTSVVTAEIIGTSHVCPQGDGGVLQLDLHVNDPYGVPLPDIPAPMLVAVLSDSGKISCLGDSTSAENDTGGSGNAQIEIRNVGGCGYITLDVYADGVLIGQATVWLTSPDLNGDCFVDFVDLIRFGDYYASSDPCADMDGSGDVGLADQIMFLQHYGNDMYHFCVDPHLSQFSLEFSNPECFVLCPEGDIQSLASIVNARNSLNEVFEYSSIPAESIRVTVPPPNSPGIDASFRFVCRSQKDRAIADHDTDANEQTTVTVNSGGGHSENMPMRTALGGWVVDAWVGTAKSPDIDANGRVDYTDVMIFSIDDQGAYNFRSDMNCDDDINNTDFLFINAHYGHRCGTSSHALAAGDAGSRPWSNEVVTATRAVVPNSVLDQWLSFDLHPELRKFLEEVRSLVEPDDLARGDEKTGAASASLLPRVTAIAQSAPNPFRVTALINYQVAAPGGKVEIVIFDVAGRRIRTLVDEVMPPGFYAVPWDGRTDSGRAAASGVYFYQMKAPGFTSNRRMMLVR